MARPSKYPIHPRQLVLQVLQNATTPLSAYNILKQLADCNIHAPMVVYRALEVLLKEKKIHKIKGLNEFIICRCEHQHDISLFTVCELCHKVNPLKDDSFVQYILALKARNINITQQANIELPIICDECQK